MHGKGGLKLGFFNCLGFWKTYQKDACRFLELLNVLNASAWESKSKDDTMKRNTGFSMLHSTNNHCSPQVHPQSFVQCIVLLHSHHHLHLCLYFNIQGKQLPCITRCVIHNGLTINLISTIDIYGKLIIARWNFFKFFFDVHHVFVKEKNSWFFF
jgi:hypothetical protein